MELIELEKKEYDTFVKNNKYKSHFLQSYVWGEFSRKEKGLIPYYVGLKDNEKLIGAALLLQKKLPLSYSYFYSPRGFVIDFNDEHILKEMTSKIIQFIKKKKGIFLKIDPDIVIKKTNYLGEEIPLDYDYKKIFSSITKLGYKHLGFTKNFETSQPRYTFRIDMNNDLDTIYDHFSKTTKQRIKKAEKLGCEVKIGNIDDISTFYHLMTLTEDRKDFVSYNKKYYETQYKLFEKEDMIKLFLGSINITKVINNLTTELDEVNKDLENIDKENLSRSGRTKLNTLESRKESLCKEIDKYKNYKEEYGDDITLSAHMIINYGDKAWVLYAGNHNILAESYTNYLTYYEHIKYCKEHNIKIYDQFGTIGDLSKTNKRLGLHEFKKKFGGDYIEFIGEFDYITNPILYFLFNKMVPFYRKLVKRKQKGRLVNEVKGNK